MKKISQEAGNRQTPLGPKHETLKIEGDWADAVKKSLSPKKPPD